MNKTPLISVILAASLALTGCGSEDEEEIDYRDDLTDLELAKDFTQRFMKVETAIVDMQEPMIETTEQFFQDTSAVNTDAVEASLEAFDATLAFAVTAIAPAFVRNELDELTSIDYSQILASQTITSLMAEACTEDPCIPEIDLTTDASVTFQNNTLTVSNAEVNVELFDYYIQYVETEPYVWEENVIRNSKGTFTSTISFDITLLSEDLEGANTAAFAISNVSLTSADTEFSVTVDGLDATGVIQSESVMSLFDAVATEEELIIDTLRATLDNAIVQFGDATFKGELSLNGENTESGRNAVATVSGELINSVGDSIKAVFDLTQTAYLSSYDYQSEYEVDESGADVNTYARSDSEAYNFDYNLELIFDSVEHGELAVKMAALGSYEEANGEGNENSYHPETYENSNTSYSTETESLLASGNIQVSVADETLRLSYNYQRTQELDGSSEYDSAEGTNTSEWTNTYTDAIKIEDASYSDRSVYFLIDLMKSGGYTTDGDLMNEFQDSEVTSGVYVDDILYGEYEFDALNNTQEIVFIDESRLSLNN